IFMTKTSPTAEMTRLVTTERNIPDPSRSGCRLGSARMRKIDSAGASMRGETVTGSQSSADVVPIHPPQRITDQLEACTVGITEVQRRSADVVVLHPGVVELLLQALPRLGRDRD